MNELVKVNDLLPIRSFSEEGNLGTIGKVVEFKKGQWYVDGQPVTNGERFVADMRGGYRCVNKWFDGHPVDGTFQLASIASDERLPHRNDLGDLDESRWEEGIDGKARDPWVYGHRQLLKGWDDGDAYTFRTSSWGGKRAMQLLYGAYYNEAKDHPGCYPVVELSQEKVMHKTFGAISEPRFPIIGWRDLEGAPQIEVTPDDPRTMIGQEINDEIPF
jgi:hypothetical protein